MRATAFTPVSNAVTSAREQLRRRLRSPFRADVGAPLLVHCSHHKVGTVWFSRVLGEVARSYNLNFEVIGRNVPSVSTDVFLFNNTNRFDRSYFAGRSFRGSHLIRDPRDLAVSAYHYHLRTSEQWARVPEDRWEGKSYQDYLQSMSFSDGLLAEIGRCAQAEWRHMGIWDYQQEEFLELRYEDLLSDESGTFERLFHHYGFRERECRASLAATRQFSLEVVRASNDRHVRSGRPGEWREVFEPRHVDRFKELTGDLIVRLGYESSTDW
jgi:hypothetical protein